MTKEPRHPFQINEPAYGECARERGRAWFDSIDSLLPAIIARRAETEALGKCHPDSVAEMVKAGVFRALTPRQYGGLEIDPASYFGGMAKLASACASTGWCASLLSVHSWQISLFAPELQQKFWARSPDTICSSSYAPTGTATIADGGFRISGQWGFSSGVDYSEWTILGGVVTIDGTPEYRMFLVPRAEIMVDDASWNVVGLQGTGSKTVRLESVFVPDHHTHAASDVHDRSERGFAVNDRPLYHLPFLSMFWSAISCVAVGAAEGALREFIADCSRRVSPLTGVPAAMNPFVQLRVAQALGDVHLVRDRMVASWGQLFAEVCQGTELGHQDRLRNRFESSDAITKCYGAVSDVMEVGGGTAIGASKPSQRFFRDLLAVRNHPTANFEPVASLYAMSLLGTPFPPFDKSSISSLLMHT